MAVPQAEHATVVVAGAFADDFHQAEVAHTVVSEAVRLDANLEVGGLQGIFDLLDEPMVRDGVPGLSGFRGDDIGHLHAWHFVSAAMQAEFRLRALGWWFSKFLDHVLFLSIGLCATDW